MLDFEIDHLVKEDSGQIVAYVKVFRTGIPEKSLKTYCIAYKDAKTFKEKIRSKTEQLKADVAELDLKEVEINISLGELKGEFARLNIIDMGV